MLILRGNKEVLKKRLKSYFKKKKLAQSNIATEQQNSKLQYLLVIDFEATCEVNAPATYNHEIIEFPIVVVNCLTRTVVSCRSRSDDIALRSVWFIFVLISNRSELAEGISITA